MILDHLMPRYDVVERHRITVRAPAEVTWAAIRDADLAGGVVPRALLAIRRVPAAILAFLQSPHAAIGELKDRRTGRAGGARLADFERSGFSVVAELAPEELVIGLLGRFWTPHGGLRTDVSARSFAAPVPAGHALAGWNFTIIRNPDGSSELRTETRVLCAPEARWKFQLYWLAVRPGSGLIRHAMLNAIRIHAERLPTESRSMEPAMPDGDPPRGYAEDPDSYVFIEDDGSARELTPDEREFIATEFLPGDSGRPYIKGYYRQRTPDGHLSGFLARSDLPRRIVVRPAPSPEA